MEDLSKLSIEIKAWSDKTFGMHRIATPIVYHLKKEVNELIEALDVYHKGNYSEEMYQKNFNSVMEEFADCYMLLIDAASHFPVTQDQILIEVRKKLEINKLRKWGSPDENGIVEHIK